MNNNIATRTFSEMIKSSAFMLNSSVHSYVGIKWKRSRGMPTNESGLRNTIKKIMAWCRLVYKTVQHENHSNSYLILWIFFMRNEYYPSKYTSQSSHSKSCFARSALYDCQPFAQHDLSWKILLDGLDYTGPNKKIKSPFYSISWSFS